jgi:Tol biopolymer transport system component
VNPDQRRVAYVAREDGAEFVVFDRRNGRRYSRVRSLTFSPDGRRLAYVARQGDRALVVIDGEEGKQYDHIAAGPLFSRDSKRFAYVAATGTQSFLVVDGREGPPSENFVIDHGLTFSGDGVRVARKTTAGGKQFVMLSDGSHRKYDAVRGPSISFAPHFNRLAYVAKEGGEEFVVEEGRAWKRHSAIVRGPVFASNGTRLAYVARNGGFGRQFVVVDGIEDKHYDEITSGPLFSPDGKRYAYTARLDQSEVVVIDGREHGKYWSVGYGPLFSPDSRRVAWTVKTSPARGLVQHVVVDGNEGTRYSEVSIPVFSPDSRQVAYAARTVDMWCMVIDEHEGKKYSGRFGRFFRKVVSEPVFTPDGRHVAYAAATGRSTRGFDIVIVDGVEDRPAGEILAGPDGWFQLNDHQLRYLVRNGDRVVLIDQFVSQ